MRGDMARNRRDEVVTAKAITRFDMVLFEDHLTGCPKAGRVDSWCLTSGLGDFAGSTEKIVTGCTGDVVGHGRRGPSWRRTRSLVEEWVVACHCRVIFWMVERPAWDRRWCHRRSSFCARDMFWLEAAKMECAQMSRSDA